MLTTKERASKAAKVKNEKYYQIRLAEYLKDPNHCLNCQEPIIPQDRNLCNTKNKKFCNTSCAATFNNQFNKAEPKPKEKKIRSVIDWDNITKAEIFENRSNWQSARSGIRRHAFQKYQGTYECDKCKYSKHTEICHSRPVSDFPMTATLGEINHPNNLIRLCPNHHWELDHQQG